MITRRRPGQTQPNHILCVVTDGHTAIAHTEATLDTWWASLTPEQKAEAYELHLGPAEEPQKLPAPHSFDAASVLAVAAETKRRIAELAGGAFTQH